MLLVAIVQSAAGQEPRVDLFAAASMPIESPGQPDSCDSNAEGLIRGALVGAGIGFLVINSGSGEHIGAVIAFPAVGAVAGLVLGYYFDKWDCDPPEEPTPTIRLDPIHPSRDRALPAGQHALYVDDF